MRFEKIARKILFLSFITIPVILNDGALAQNSDDARKARSALERTDEVITQAREVIQDSRSQKGRLRLENAEAIQDKAWQAYRKQAAYSLALRLTYEARQEANQAMGLARLEVQTEARLSRVVEETIERMARVRDLIIESNITAEQALKLLEEARNLLEKSRLNANQYRYQLAMKLADNAHQRVVRAEQQVRRLRSLKEMDERRLEFLSRLMERARLRVQESQDQGALQQLHLAGEQLEKARELLREGRYRAAKLAIEKCERTLRNLIRRFRLESISDPGTLLNEAYRLLERAKDMISRREGEGAGEKDNMLIQEAQRLIGRAEREIKDNHEDEARRLLNEARKILQRAAREERDVLTPEEITSMIRRAETTRDEALTIAGACTAPGLDTLLERASGHMDKARAHLDGGRLENAAAEARIALNMFSRIREICTD